MTTAKQDLRYIVRIPGSKKEFKRLGAALSFAQARRAEGLVVTCHMYDTADGVESEISF